MISRRDDTDDLGGGVVAAGIAQHAILRFVSSHK
jgi:hypothetical protein